MKGIRAPAAVAAEAGGGSAQNDASWGRGRLRQREVGSGSDSEDRWDSEESDEEGGVAARAKSRPARAASRPARAAAAAGAAAGTAGAVSEESEDDGAGGGDDEA